MVVRECDGIINYYSISSRIKGGGVVCSFDGLLVYAGGRKNKEKRKFGLKAARPPLTGQKSEERKRGEKERRRSPRRLPRARAFTTTNTSITFISFLDPQTTMMLRTSEPTPMAPVDSHSSSIARVVGAGRGA